MIRMDCAAGMLHSRAISGYRPARCGSGQASGKRMHKPFTIVKEWGAATPQLMAMKTGYDIKKVEGHRRRETIASDDWSPISLANSEELCAARRQRRRSSNSSRTFRITERERGQAYAPVRRWSPMTAAK